MALDSLLRRSVPLEWWDNRPDHGWLVLISLAGLTYAGAPWLVEALGYDGAGLLYLLPAALVAWLVLAWGHVALCVELPALGWAKAHRALCVVYMLPALAALVVVALAVGLVVLGVWANMRSMRR